MRTYRGYTVRKGRTTKAGTLVYIEKADTDFYSEIFFEHFENYTAWEMVRTYIDRLEGEYYED